MRPGKLGIGAAAAIVCSAGALAHGAPVASAAAGDLDPSFSGDGRAQVSFPGGPNQRGRAGAIDSAGRIVIVGSVGTVTSDTAVARLTPAGELDPSFSGDGKVVENLADHEEAVGVAIDSQDRIVVAVDATNSVHPTQWYLLRYLPSGQLDNSFGGGDGIAVTNMTNGGIATSLVIDGVGRPVTAGWAIGAGDNDFAVTRHTTTGTPDASFGGGDGIRLIAFAGFHSELAHGVATDAANRVIVAGEREDPVDGNRTDFETVRLNEDGAFLDSGFGASGGILDIYGSTLDDGATNVVLDSQGRIVLTTLPPQSSVATTGDFGLIRLLGANGAVDPTFGVSGFVRSDQGGIEYARDLAIDGPGRIVVAGESAGAGNTILVDRYDQDGALDASFGGDGHASADFAGIPDPVALGVDVDPQGRPVAFGYLGDGGGDGPALALARFEAETPCNKTAATLTGSAGKDVLKGTKKADVIAGLGGPDRILGRGGKDVICGGDGKDFINGGPGNDVLLGEGGADRLVGGKGKDRLRGGKGKDTQAQD